MVYRSELFTDLTLVTEDLRECRAHRLVASSGSKVLQKILTLKSMEREPVIFLSGILHEDLDFILQFLYYGDVRVPQDRVTSILAAASSLQVPQLCGAGSESVKTSEKSLPRETSTVKHNTLSKSKEKPLTTIAFKSTRKSSNNHSTTDDTPETEAQDAEFFDDIDVNDYDLSMENQEEEWNENFVKDEKATVPRQRLRRCKQCDVIFNEKSEFNHHMVSLHDKTLHHCQNCEYNTIHRHDLKTHVQTMHENKKFPCTSCDYAANSSSNLRAHMNIHEGKKRKQNRT